MGRAQPGTLFPCPHQRSWQEGHLPLGGGAGVALALAAMFTLLCLPTSFFTLLVQLSPSSFEP